MPAYMSRRERQGKHADLLTELAGPLRRFLPDPWVLAAGGVTTRVAAFPPSGHGMVHAAPSAFARPVMSLRTGMAPVGEDKGRTSAAGIRHGRILQGATTPVWRTPLEARPAGCADAERTGRSRPPLAWQKSSGCGRLRILHAGHAGESGQIPPARFAEEGMRLPCGRVCCGDLPRHGCFARRCGGYMENIRSKAVSPSAASFPEGRHISRGQGFFLVF